MFGFKIGVQGDQLVSRKFEKLAGRSSRSAARSGISKGLTIIARGIRKAIPPKLKSVKKTVGSRQEKAKEKGVFSAKVGLGVGKSRAPKNERDPNRPGVGISKNNVHWWELGTRSRRREDGSSTGAMPKGPPVVREGFEAKKKEAQKAMIKQIKLKMKQDAKKKRKKK